MKVCDLKQENSAVAASRGWIARARSVATPSAALAVCLLMPVAGALEKAVAAGASAVATGDTAAPTSAASAQGTWNFVMKTPIGERKVVFKFVVDGTALKGTMTDDEGTSEIFKGSVEGTTLKWSVKVSKPMSMTLDYTGVLNGDAISGVAKGMLGSAKFTGQRA